MEEVVLPVKSSNQNASSQSSDAKEAPSTNQKTAEELVSYFGSRVIYVFWEFATNDCCFVVMRYNFLSFLRKKILFVQRQYLYAS